MACKTSQSARRAVTPCIAYPVNAPVLWPEILPRNTSAITDTIQVTEISHTMKALIHHNIVASPPLCLHAPSL